MGKQTTHKPDIYDGVDFMYQPVHQAGDYEFNLCVFCRAGALKEGSMAYGVLDVCSEGLYYKDVMHLE